MTVPDWESVYRRVDALVSTMQTLVQRDPEQEVLGMALPVIDAVLEYARRAAPDDPVVQAVADTLSAEQIAAGEPVRAAEVLVVASQLREAIYALRPSPGGAFSRWQGWPPE